MNDSRFKRFEQIYQTHPLVKYFGLKHNYDVFEIVPQKTDMDKLSLHVQVVKNHYHHFNHLPSDINNVISEYLQEYITICFEITFPYDYPFKPPIYTLVSTKSNLVHFPLSIDGYYASIVERHNLQYAREWTPAMDIEKDVLYFICRINHFEYLL
jgi:ubiquitin-protein ligase